MHTIRCLVTSYATISLCDIDEVPADQPSGAGCNAYQQEEVHGEIWTSNGSAVCQNRTKVQQAVPCDCILINRAQGDQVYNEKNEAEQRHGYNAHRDTALAAQRD